MTLSLISTQVIKTPEKRENQHWGAERVQNGVLLLLWMLLLFPVYLFFLVNIFVYVLKADGLGLDDS